MSSAKPKFKVGDTVLIARTQNGQGIPSTRGMHDLLGKTGEITKMVKIATGFVYEIHGYAWGEDSIDLATQEKVCECSLDVLMIAGCKCGGT